MEVYIFYKHSLLIATKITKPMNAITSSESVWQSEYSNFYE